MVHWKKICFCFIFSCKSLKISSIYLYCSNYINNYLYINKIVVSECLYITFQLIIIYILFQCRLIVAQMSKTRCEAHNNLLSFMVVAILFSVFLPPIELICMYIMALISILTHIYYGGCVVSKFTLFL